MKKFHERKRKKFKLSDEWKTVFVTQKDLMEICGYSRSQAYKITTGQRGLPKHMLELLKLKLLANIPEWPPGWYVEDGYISCPNGFKVNHHHLENFSFFMSILKDIHKDIDRLAKENKELRGQLKERQEIRVYVNDGKKPERVLKIIK